MKKKKIFQLTFSILFSTLLVVSLVYAWTAPSQNPPGGNVEAPINVSDTAQSKLGNFGLGGGAGQPLYWLKNVGGALYFSSTNPAGDRVVIGQDGNVGIGTTNPGAELHLAGSDNTPTLLIRPNSMAGGDISQIRFEDPDGGTGAMSIQYKDDGSPDLAIMGGNVGIGTTGPGSKLDVAGTLAIRQGYGSGIYAPYNYGAINFARANNDNAFLYPYIGNNSLDLRLYLQDDGTERFSIWGDSCHNGGCSQGTTNAALGAYIQGNGQAYFKGKVGIGTMGPGAKLDVEYPLNTTGLELTSPNYDGDRLNAGLRFHSNTNTGAQGDVVFYHNGKEGAAVDIWGYPSNSAGGCCHHLATFGVKNNGSNYQYFSGNVGIGTTNPQGKLHIKAAGSKVIIEI